MYVIEEDRYQRIKKYSEIGVFYGNILNNIESNPCTYSSQFSKKQSPKDFKSKSIFVKIQYLKIHRNCIN